MTMSPVGFKLISLAVMAVLCLAAPTTSAAYGAIQTAPNVNGPQAESGTLLQESEDADEAAGGAEEGESATDEASNEGASAEESAEEEIAEEQSAEESDDAGDTEE